MNETASKSPTDGPESTHSEYESTGIDLAREMQAQRPASAWAMSMLVHTALVVVLGITWTAVPRGAAIESPREVGIVLVHQQQGKREYIDPTVSDSVSDASASAIASAMPNVNEAPTELTEILPGAADIVAGGNIESLLDATNLTGDGRPRYGGKHEGTSTKVFGITGVGTNFVYVFDRSGSMDNYGGRPLLAAKTELLRSLDDLDSVHQFQIIFYNKKPKIFTMDGRQELIWGETENKLRARDFVNRIKADGGTEHVAPLKRALGMHPDVIFFLTDADQPRLTFGELQRIRSWNRGTTIHAIEFGAGPEMAGDNFLQKLARQNGGQHQYVDVTVLRVKQ